jgi:hypothetical protein
MCGRRRSRCALEVHIRPSVSPCAVRLPQQHVDKTWTTPLLLLNNQHAGCPFDIVVMTVPDPAE